MSKINAIWEEVALIIRGYFVPLVEVVGSSPARWRNLQGNDSGHAMVDLADTSRIAKDKAKSRIRHTCHDSTEVTTAGGIAFTVPTTGLHTFKLVNDDTSLEEYLIAGVLYVGELKLMTTASASSYATIWYL